MEQASIINNKKVNIVLNAFIIFFLFGIFVAGIYVQTEEVKLTTDTSKNTVGQWKDAITGEEITDKTIVIDPGESAEIEMSLDRDLTDDYIFFFYDTGFRTNAYINGQIIAEFGKDNIDRLGKETGSIWRKFSLSKDMSYQVLTLSFYNDTDSPMGVQISKLYCGTEAYLSAIIIKESALEIVICFCCTVAAIILIIMAVVLKMNKFDVYTKRINTLAFLSLLAGLWVLSDGSVLQFVFENASVRYMLDKFSLFLVPIALNHYFELTVRKNPDFFRLLGFAYKLLMIICLFMYRLNIIHISQTIFLVHAFLIMEILLIGHTGASEYRARRDLDSLSMVIGFPIIGLFMGAGLYVYYFSPDVTKVADIIGIGYMTFVVAMFLTQMKNTLEEYEERQKIKQYEDMMEAMKGLDFNIEEVGEEENEDS